MIPLNVNRIRTAEERFEQVYRPEQMAVEGDTFRVAAPVHLAFDIHKDKDQFRLVGSVKTTLELPCSRCLEHFAWPVDAVFDLRYHPHARNTGEGEIEIEDDDLASAFYQDDTIDLGQLMEEQLYLSLPMKPLCREDCKGLCPACGTNWNKGQCQCTNQWEDPRLEALKALKTDHHKGH